MSALRIDLRWALIVALVIPFGCGSDDPEDEIEVVDTEQALSATEKTQLTAILTQCKTGEKETCTNGLKAFFSPVLERVRETVRQKHEVGRKTSSLIETDDLNSRQLALAILGYNISLSVNLSTMEARGTITDEGGGCVYDTADKSCK